jgi:hypothetical protein
MIADAAARAFARTGRSRRAIAGGLALAGLINVAAAAILDRFPVPIRFAEAAAVLDRVRHQTRQPDVLVLGSSSLRSLVDLGTLDAALRGYGGRPAVTIASAVVSAGDAPTMRWLFERLTDEGVRPRQVIVEFTPEVLTAPTPFLKEDVTRYFGLRDIWRSLPEIVRTDARARTLSARLVPLYLFRLEILRWWSGTDVPPTWVPRAATAAAHAPGIRPLDAPQYPAAVRASMLGRAWEDYAVGPLSREALTAMADRAAAIDARLTFVIPPVASLLRTMESRDGWAQIDGVLATLTIRAGVTAVNCRARLDDAMFHDANHANATGARVFSELLAREVQSAGLAPPSDDRAGIRQSC